MPKTSGGTRMVSPGTREYKGRVAEVAMLRATGLYSSVEFFPDGGGYVAIEKSPARHKAEEIEVANALANSGYKVTLSNEAGQVKTPDGYAFTMSYEQRTPTSRGAKSVKNAMDHAMEKYAKVALIYDKHKNYHRDTIEAGIKEFEKYHSKNWRYRFKRIIVVSSSGKVYEHTHND